MVQVGPMRMGVHRRLVLVDTAAPGAGRHAGMQVRMVAVVMPVGMLVPHCLVPVPVNVALEHEQSDRRGEERRGNAVRDAANGSNATTSAISDMFSRSAPEIASDACRKRLPGAKPPDYSSATNRSPISAQ